jgi:integrase
MGKFLQSMGAQEGFKDPAGFLAWAKQRDNLDVEDVIEKFADTHTRGTWNTGLATLRSFLRWNGYNLPKTGWAPIDSYLPGYSRPQILSLLSYLPKKHHKLAVYLTKDSGLRVNDLLRLRYGHMKDDLEAGLDCIHIRFEPQQYARRKAPGFTFIGPNSLDLLRPMIRDGTLGTSPDDKIVKISYSPLNEALNLAKEKAGLDPKLQPTHGLRKFFENCLDKVGMDHHLKMQLEGHFQGTRKHYTSRVVDELRGLYKQAYDYLDLTEKAASKTANREFEGIFLDQQNRITMLEAELAYYKNKSNRNP